MKNYFVDFEGWVKVEAENVEDAKRILCSLIRKWRLEGEVQNCHFNIDTVEEEEE